MSNKLPTLLEPGSLSLAEGLRAPAGETPIDYIVAWLRRRMPEYGGHAAALADRVLIVRARTGSGKSTILPVAVFRILRSEATATRARFRGAGVICTQPRVLTAVALARDVSSRPWNRDMVLGETVGYQTGPVSNRPASGLVYATAGVLAAQLQQQEDSDIMSRYRFIIVDEAHERSLDSDINLMLLRNFYERNVGNERLPFLILTSATFDPARYAEYFGVGPENCVEVRGRQYGIETHFPAAGTNNYLAEAAATAVRIHEGGADDPPARADILVFVPGAAEATAVAAALAKANQKYTAPPRGRADSKHADRHADRRADEHADGPESSLGPMLILVINREVVASQTGDFLLVFEAPDRLPLVGGRRPARRVVVSTVVAETGLTIDTLRYVIDCGWSRARETYPIWGASGLLTRPAAQSRINQRMGRVGRLFPGDFYPLYTKNVFDALDPQQLPDIITVGPADIYLAAVREQQRQKLRLGQVPEFRAEDMTLIDPPPTEAFLAVNAAAIALGFVAARAQLPDRWPPALYDSGSEDPETPPLAVKRGYGLTRLGFIASTFTRTPMEGVRIVLAGYVWDAAASDLITAAAMIGTPLADLLAERDATPVPRLPPGAAALRAALPGFLAARTVGGGGMAIPPTESEAFYFRAKLILADDFAEAVLVFDAFARRLEAAAGDIGSVAAWCSDLNLRPDALLELARRRDTIMEEMIIAGLNPYRNEERRLARLSVEDFTRGLILFKRSLYDGLRGRLLRYDEKAASYLTRQGLRVKVPPLLTDALADRLRALLVTRPEEAPRPRWILTDQIRLSPMQKAEEERAPPHMYTVAANLVSILDGYVDPDPDFDGPRTRADTGEPPVGPGGK